MTRTCPFCATEFEASNPRKRYCSPRCAIAGSNNDMAVGRDLLRELNSADPEAAATAVRELVRAARYAFPTDPNDGPLTQSDWHFAGEDIRAALHKLEVQS